MVGTGGTAREAYSAVFAFTDKYNSCSSVGESTMHICATNGVFINSVHLDLDEIISNDTQHSIQLQLLTTITDNISVSVTTLLTDVQNVEGNIMTLEGRLNALENNMGGTNTTALQSLVTEQQKQIAD